MHSKARFKFGVGSAKEEELNRWNNEEERGSKYAERQFKQNIVANKQLEEQAEKNSWEWRRR